MHVDIVVQYSMRVRASIGAVAGAERPRVPLRVWEAEAARLGG